MNGEVDVRDVLGSVRVPTLVLHRRGDSDSRLEEGKYLADRIHGARFVELPGADHFVAVDPDQILDQVESFLAATPDDPAPRSALAAVLAVAGPGAAGAVAGLRSGGGRPGCTPAGDALVVFDGPATALRAAADELARVERPPVRMGLHIAEVPVDTAVLDGPGVRVSSALAELASDHQLIASSAVRDLVAGTGIELQPCGLTRLGGGEAQHVFGFLPGSGLDSPADPRERPRAPRGRR
jgi:hypothetical protein